MPTLRDLQDGLRRAILGEDEGVAAAIRADGLTAGARIAIYRHHVLATLTDVLRAAYPVVRRLVDDRFFAYAADRYIRREPPAGPCLFEYGGTFPEFLGTFPPCRELVYLADVARLEWAMQVAFHAQEVSPLAPAGLSAVPATDTAHLGLRLDPSIAYVESAWPIDQIWEANQPDADPERTVTLESGGVWLEVRRVGDAATFRGLAPACFAFRRAIHVGRSLGEAAEAALAVDSAFDLTDAVRALLHEELLVGLALSPLTTETE